MFIPDLSFVLFVVLVSAELRRGERVERLMASLRQR